MAIKVGDLTVEPVEADLTDIHPSIGVADGKAYVAIFQQCVIRSSKHTAIRELPFLVFEDGEKVLVNEEVFNPKNWRLVFKPIKIPNRWGIGYVSRFLNGERSVHPGEVFAKICDVWKACIEFNDVREYFFQSLWAIGTYFHHLFKTYPYNYITGTKRSGKTKCLTLHAAICFNAFFSNNMSSSSIYRLIQNAKGTLLIDETEKLANPERNLEFRSILLSGYKRGAVVYRVEKTRKEQLIPEAFEVYSPKALANISGVEDVLEDRCIITVMRRSVNRAVVDRQVDVDSELWSELRHLLYLLYLNYWREVKEIYDKICELSEHNELVNFVRNMNISCEGFENLSSRELELWQPILALALFLEKYVFPTKFTSSLSSLSSLNLFAEIVGLACDKAKQRHTEELTETWEIILAQTLVELVKANGWYKIRDIKNEMAKRFDEEEKGLNTRWVGNALRRLGFKEKRRLGTGYEYRLTVEDVKDLAVRMGAVDEAPKALGDVVNRLHETLSDQFTDDEFMRHTQALGLGEAEAVEVLKKLLADNRLMRDILGCLRWVS